MHKKLLFLTLLIITPCANAIISIPPSVYQTIFKSLLENQEEIYTLCLSRLHSQKEPPLDDKESCEKIAKEIKLLKMKIPQHKQMQRNAVQ